MKNKTHEQLATDRMMMIMPLIEEGLEHHRRVELQKQISEKHGVSYRTVGRYLEAYQNGGFEGLKPKTGYTRKESSLPENFPDVLEQAIILRREAPTRSVKDILRILELEGRIKPGSVSRSTLQRHLQAAGFGAKQIRLYTKKGTASRRFTKPHRCMLFQGDIKYGPHIPIEKGGKKQQVYLSAFIDDATRFIVSAKFYDNQRVEIIEDSLRTAIMHYGKPDAIYVDNGKQYRSEWLKKACAKLGIRLLFARPYHPEGKGKIEAFNRRMEAFLSEAALARPESLAELNRLLELWIEQHYHKQPHHGLDGISPAVAFKSDSRPLRFVDAKACAEAFLHTATREVDKTGCISFKGTQYEVGISLIGRKVEVSYDPSWTDEVEIHYQNMEPFKAKKLQIGRNCGVRSELPIGQQVLETDHSRLLDGLNEANISGRTKKEVAVLFRKIREENANV